MSAKLIPFEKSALELHNDAMSTAIDIKSRYLDLFEILLVVEERKIYLEFDIPSLHLYCVELLQLSRATANDFVYVIRKSLEVPELATAIREQKITVSKARKICSVMTAENHKGWIDLAIHCSCREVERTVAMANPREAVVESLKYVSGERLELKLGVSEEWSELLTRTKDLLSQEEKRNVSSEEALFILMSRFCKKNDPIEKAKRATISSQKSRATKAPSVATGETFASVKSASEDNDKNRTRYRPAGVEHIVDLRDRCQCTFIYADGRRCESRRWLAKHHVIEFADGGEHTPENLVTLCWGHHKIVHLKNGH